MNRNILLPLVGIAIIALVFYLLTKTTTPGPDYKNISYMIDGKSVQLVNGKSGGTEVYFGNEAKGDFNGDGKDDFAFLLFNQGGGSGTFYYLAAALSAGEGYVGTNGILLGDRIAPQTTEVHDGQIVVNYADRSPSEPFTTQPHIGVSKYVKVSGNKLVEVK